MLHFEEALVRSAGASFYRVMMGFLLSAAVAIPLGLFMGTYPPVKHFFAPILDPLRFLPISALVPLFIVWFGIEETPKILLLFLAAFAPVAVGTEAGIRHVRRSWIDQALTLGAGRMYVFLHVMIPASLPQIFASVRLAVGFAFTTLVAAELVAATSGIGWMVLDASKFLRVDVIYVGIIAMGITALLVDRVIRLIENRVIPWRGYA